jgi:D-alanine-D-alanine ligase
LEIPANISGEILSEIQLLAIKTFRVLCCEGLSRVDFFLKKNGGLLVNEINTMPGFTKISMYPKLWENPLSPSLNGNTGGISYTDLITMLIEFAIARWEKEQKIKTTV